MASRGRGNASFSLSGRRAIETGIRARAMNKLDKAIERTGCMSSTTCRFRVVGRALLSLATLLATSLSVSAQCGDPLPKPPPPGNGGVLLYSLRGQTVQVDGKGGGFSIANVSAPDVFPADFVGDDFLFLTGMKITDQGITYAYGLVPFQISVGGMVFIDPASVIETTIPPPLPESLTLTTVGSPVIEVGMTRPLQAIAKLTNGTTQPVTLPSQWTTYRISNDHLVRVIPDNPNNPTMMLVEALSPGTVFITATNGGATSVKEITVVPVGGTITTTVEGFVVRQDGSMVNGAGVNVQVYGASPVLSGPNGNPSWPNGFFSLPIVLPEEVTEIVAEAVVQTESQTEFGASPSLTPIPNGITDAGLIVIELFCDTPWSTAFGPTLLEGGAVQAFAVFDNDGTGPQAPRLFAGGKFSKAGGTDAGLVAQWDGNAWQPVGGSFTPGPNGSLFADDDGLKALSVLDLNDGNGPLLYAGGSFVEAENVTSAIALARWNGTNWSGVGGGVGESHATANTLVAFNNELYVGGNFLTAGLYDSQNGCLPQNGCVNAKRIAKWNPITNTWSQVGTGFDNGEVLTLAVFQNELYAGGDFTLTNGQFVNHVVKWTGSQWAQVGNGLSTGSGAGRVTSFLVFDDGSGPALYAGGDFFGASGNYISRWNGSTWTAVGPGFNTNEVKALAGWIVGANRYLYASGSFANISGGAAVNYIARWNGTSWSALNTGLEAFGTALAVFDHGKGPLIHVGGEVCTGNCPAFVAATASRGGGRGGSRDKNARLAPTYSGFVATWNAGEWSVLGNGLSDEVHAVTVHDDGSGPALIVGGKFKPPRGPRPDNPAPFPTNGIAKFDGMEWSSLGTGMTKSGSNPPPADVRAVVTFDEDGTGPNAPRLFAGGDFNLAGGVSANYVAHWDGSAWSAVGNVGGIVNALAAFDEDGAGANPPRLFAGGDFANRISRWNGSTWSAVGAGINNGSVTSLAVYNNALYVGGAFTNAAGVGANYLARWNGSSWSTVTSGGSGTNAAVYALTVFDPDDEGPLPLSLFAGGDFTTAGGITASRVARWDGTVWSRVGPASDPGLGINHVYALYGFENALGRFLYAGGDFTQSSSGGLTLIAQLRADRRMAFIPQAAPPPSRGPTANPTPHPRCGPDVVAEVQSLIATLAFHCSMEESPQVPRKCPHDHSPVRAPAARVPIGPRSKESSEASGRGPMGWDAARPCGRAPGGLSFKDSNDPSG